ncbi:choline kinase family protein [Chitinophaga vietnamensis]|uniref:choline kinase family protein n=1 Tax=Chitinophaga vietnamensis TaxID=2593957 RepID=UPI00117818B9|nr:choline kinase family protein [Chitinophaga vietnamensis]
MTTNTFSPDTIITRVQSILLEEVVSCDRLPHGMTNFNYKICTIQDAYVYRIPGGGANLLIDRKEEKDVLQQISSLGIDVETIYYESISGIKLTRFVENIPLSSCPFIERSQLVAGMLQRLHASGITFKNTFDPMERISFYESVLIDYHIPFFHDFPIVKQQLASICRHLLPTSSAELVPCHNDIVPENILLTPRGKAYLIDWEYAGMNHVFWDLASYCIENNLSTEEEEIFLYIYLSRPIADVDLQNMLLFKALQDILWSLWSAVKVHFGANFGNYGANRYHRGLGNLSILLHLIKFKLHNYVPY